MTPLAARLREEIAKLFEHSNEPITNAEFERIELLALLLPECVERLYEDGHGANAHATCKACQTLARIEREIGGMG